MCASSLLIRGILAAAAVLVVVTTAPVQAQESKTTDKELLGKLGMEDLLDVKGWFDADFAAYEPSKYYCDMIREKLGATSVVCVLGTWCDDSKREVPRLIKVLQALNFDPAKLQFIGVNHDKQSPGGEQIAYGIDKVPTIIFLRDGRELGRIVEKPVKSIEQDFLAFLEGRDPAAPVEEKQDMFIPANGAMEMGTEQKSDPATQDKPKQEQTPDQKTPAK